MNIQQLEYIVAVDKLRHFVNAAEACNVTQPTLSMMIRRLEEELDVQIFDRSDVPVQTTEIGSLLIRQAEKALKEINKMKEIVEDKKQLLTGTFNLGIIPTIAPYLVPELLRNKDLKCKELALGLTENISGNIIAEILEGKLDGGLMATPLNNSDLLEYPIYYEKFYAYVSPLEKAYKEKEIDLDKVDIDHFWMFESIHYLRGQVERLCRKQKDKNDHRKVRYEAGNITTLINVVDMNAGMTIIPEMAAMSLSEEQQDNLKDFKNLTAVREVSLVVRKDYIRQNVLSKIMEIIADSVPNSMKNPELKQFAIDVNDL